MDPIYPSVTSPPVAGSLLPDWKLVLLHVGRSELTPPVAASTLSRIPAQCASQVVWTRVHCAYRDTQARLLDREAQIAVVGDDDTSIDGLLQDIEKEMRRDVDIRALLLERRKRP